MPSTISQTDKAANSVTVAVNGADVTLPDRKTTGSAIKQAAIAAGVPIQGDFVLYARRGNSSEYAKVDDDEVVTVHPGEQFRAVAPDDVA